MRHQTISFVKSFVRMIGYIVLAVASVDVSLLLYAGIVLFLSEVVGVLEEIGHD